MQFDGIALALGAIALVLLFIGIKLLLNVSCIIGWIRGNIAVLFLLLTAGLGLSIIDIRTYQPMFDEQVVAILSLEKKDSHQFKVRLVDNKGFEDSHLISGDAWRISANVIDWAPTFYNMGMRPGLRLSTLEGKFYSLSMERTRKIGDVVLNASEYIDVWSILNDFFSKENFVRAKLVIVPPQAMADGAQYEILTVGNSLKVRPLNDAARFAGSQWQEAP